MKEYERKKVEQIGLMMDDIYDAIPLIYEALTDEDPKELKSACQKVQLLIRKASELLDDE